MPDSQSNLLPPTSGDFIPGTPSGLTPNTRSEAEAALWRNSMAQTDSAAPTTPLASYPPDMGLDAGAGSNAADPLGQGVDGNVDSRRSRIPMGTNPEAYVQALREARKQSTTESDISTHTTESSTGAAVNTGASSTPTHSIPFPPPGRGVVPLHTGVGTGQAEAVRKAKPSGMKLGDLGRQASWSEQDMKHVYSAPLLGPPRQEDAGYGSGVEEGK